MSDSPIWDLHAPPGRTLPRKRPPPPAGGTIRTELLYPLFGTPSDAALTALTLVVLGIGIVFAARWAVIDSIWSAPTPAACGIQGGACWAVVHDRWRSILFGSYPRGELWRPILALGFAAVALSATVFTGIRRLGFVVAGWVVTLPAFVLLLGGGVFGLSRVGSDQWGGIPLTVLVFLSSIVIGFPLAIALAVGRTGSLVSARIVSSGLVEFIRPLPLVAVLFCADLLTPMAVPDVINPGKLGRVILCMAVFYACYQSEVLRAGFRVIPKGHVDAAKALGLKHSLTMRLVVFPQAVRITIPATVNLLVVALKDTSLIITVGLFDFLATSNSTFSGNEWRPYADEVYLFVAAVYLAMTVTLTRLGASYEREFAARG